MKQRSPRASDADHRWGQDPEHPILPRAFEWEIIGLAVDKEPLDGGEPRLDLTLRRGPDRRVLRFWSPQELEVTRGGPTFTGGFVIYDLRGRGLEGVSVRVDDFEASPGTVRFVARAVEALRG